MEVVCQLMFFFNTFFLFFGGAGGQTTVCNVDEYMAVVQNLEALRVQFMELKADFEDMKNTDIANLKATDAELKSKDSAIESSISALNEEVETEITDLRNKDTSIESSISTLESSVNTSVETLEAADAGLQTSIDGLENTVIPALQARDVDFQGKIDTADTAINSLQTLTSGHTTSLSQLSAKDTQIEMDVSTNSQALSALGTTSTSLSSRIDTLEAAMSSPVAFYAKSSENNDNYVQSGNGVPLILNDIVFESSNGLYSTATGKFTTPLVGYYVFTYRVVVTKAEYGLVVRIGSTYGSTYSVYGQSSAEVAPGQEAKAVTGTVILLLTQGAEVYVDTHNPGEVKIQECWFAGWLYKKN